MRKRCALFAVLCSLSTACASSTVSLAVTAVEKHRWRISEIYDGSSMVRAAEKFREPGLSAEDSYPAGALDILFEDGHLGGRIGCGILDGHYKQEANHVNFSGAGLVVTLAGACSRGDISYSGKVEAAFSGDRIIIQEGNSIIMNTLAGSRRVVLVPSEYKG